MEKERKIDRETEKSMAITGDSKCGILHMTLLAVNIIVLKCD